MSGVKIQANSFWLYVAQLVGTGLIALCTASWQARGVVADSHERMTIVEQHQASTDKAVDEIHTDVRELRRALLGDK